MVIFKNVFKDWPISQYYGKTQFAIDHPTYYRFGIHTGIDFVQPWDTPIRAAHDGIVVKKSDVAADAYGIFVTLWDDKQDIATRSLHMNRNIVSLGQKVLAGDIIGYMGNTGLSVGTGEHPGTHLHFEALRVKPNGYVIDWMAFGGTFDPLFFGKWED